MDRSKGKIEAVLFASIALFLGGCGDYSGKDFFVANPPTAKKVGATSTTTKAEGSCSATINAALKIPDNNSPDFYKALSFLDPEQEQPNHAKAFRLQITEIKSTIRQLCKLKNDDGSSLFSDRQILSNAEEIVRKSIDKNVLFSRYAYFRSFLTRPALGSDGKQSIASRSLLDPAVSYEFAMHLNEYTTSKASSTAADSKNPPSTRPSTTAPVPLSPLDKDLSDIKNYYSIYMNWKRTDVTSPEKKQIAWQFTEMECLQKAFDMVELKIKLSEKIPEIQKKYVREIPKPTSQPTTATTAPTTMTTTAPTTNGAPTTQTSSASDSKAQPQPTSRLTVRPSDEPVDVSSFAGTETGATSPVQPATMPTTRPATTRSATGPSTNEAALDAAMKAITQNPAPWNPDSKRMRDAENSNDLFQMVPFESEVDRRQAIEQYEKEDDFKNLKSTFSFIVRLPDENGAAIFTAQESLYRARFMASNAATRDFVGSLFQSLLAIRERGTQQPFLPRKIAFELAINLVSMEAQKQVDVSQLMNAFAVEVGSSKTSVLAAFQKTLLSSNVRINLQASIAAGTLVGG